MAGITYQEAALQFDNLYAQCDFQGATALAQQITSQLPNDADFRFNYGRALWGMGRRDDAIDQLKTAASIDQDSLEFHRTLAEMLVDAGRRSEAMSTITAAIQLSPFDIHINKLFFLVALTHPPRQCHLFCQNLEGHIGKLAEMHGNDQNSYELFATLCAIHMRGGRHSRAAELFSHCVKPLETGDAAPTTHDIEKKYASIVSAYDGAPNHQESISEFMKTVREIIGEKSGLIIIDAACGTGMAASELRPYATSLIGVDLSSAMVEIAQSRKLYDRLTVGCMINSLTAYHDNIDLIVCCGTTCYLNDLTSFFSASAKALRPGGMLIFTDWFSPPGSGTMITKGGTKRYCRSEDLIRLLAANVSLSEICDETILSFGLPVRCWGFQR